jgi:hypothetical protein
LAGKIINHNLSIGPRFNFLTPGLSQFALDMAGWEKIAVSKFDGTGFNVGYANDAENNPHADE